MAIPKSIITFVNPAFSIEKTGSILITTGSVVTISAISSGSITFTPALSNYTQIRSASLSWLDSTSLGPFYSVTGGGYFPVIDSTAFSVLFSLNSTTTIITQSNSSFYFDSASIIGSNRKFSISYLSESKYTYYDNVADEAYIQLSVDTTSNENSIVFQNGVFNSTTGEVEFTSNTPVKGGIGTSARGIGSFAMGSGSIAQESASIAEGINTLSSGLASHAAGINTTASGQAAFSMGIETDADGMASFAAGSGSWARGTATVAMGIGTIASASGQTVVGHYNLGIGDFNNLFVVGGGSGATTNLRKNLFRVYGGSGASTVGVEINTSETQYISSFDGFNVYGKTRFFGGVTGSSIDFNAVGVDTKTNLDPIGGTITTGSFTSNFYRWENLPTGGEMVLFGEVLKASVRLDHRGINFSLSEQTTNPGSTFLWTNSSNRLFYGSNAVILNDGNTLGSTMTIGTTDVNNLQLETNNTTRIFISSSGRVGIGTSSPTERLHVDGNLLVTGRITAEEFHTEFVSASIIYQSGSTQFGNSLDDTHIFTGSLKVNGSITGSLFGTSSWAINARTSSNIFPAITNNTSTYVLTATGDGTINGNSNLTFDGNDLTLSNGNIKLPVNGYVFGGDTQILNGNHVLFPANPPALPNDVLAGTSSLFARNTQIQIRSISEPDVVGGYESGSIFFKTPSGSGMTYTNEGRLGIGVSNPTNTLQIQGNVSASSYTGSLFGTSSWAINALTASFVNTASTNAFVQGGNSFGTTALLGTNDTQNLQFETSGSVRMTISSSGNIGIGTTTPSASLHIEGNFQISTGSLYTYGQNTDIDSGSIRTVMSVSTGSYRAAFFDYVLNKSTNARAGTVFSVWNGASVEWNDVSTNDIGNTAEVNLSVGLSGANVLLYASSSTNDWSMKALARML